MTLTFLSIATIIFAVQAIRSRRLIVAALWLAGASALLSLMFYLMGAHLVAVFELSVGAGLVTVLFVFAITIAGEEVLPLRSLISKPVALTLAVLLVGLLGWYALPSIAAISPPATETPLTSILWQQRSLDIFAQIMLIFAGVLGTLGLLAEAKAPLQYPAADEYAAQRERELQALHQSSLEKEAL